MLWSPLTHKLRSVYSDLHKISVSFQLRWKETRSKGEGEQGGSWGMRVCTERRWGRANTWSVSLRATPLATGLHCSHRGGNKRWCSNGARTNAHAPAERSGTRREAEEKKRADGVSLLEELEIWAKSSSCFSALSDGGFHFFHAHWSKPCRDDINIVRETLLTGRFQDLEEVGVTVHSMGTCHSQIKIYCANKTILWIDILAFRSCESCEKNTSITRIKKLCQLWLYCCSFSFCFEEEH